MAETRIGIVTNTAKSGAKDLLPRLVEGFAAKGIETRLEKDGADLSGDADGVELHELADGVDLLVVLGGLAAVIGAVRTSVYARAIDPENKPPRSAPMMGSAVAAVVLSAVLAAHLLLE